jgi:hypothetical protein
MPYKDEEFKRTAEDITRLRMASATEHPSSFIRNMERLAEEYATGFRSTEAVRQPL